MSQEKKNTAKKPVKKRNSKGQFVKGNTIGEETRFERENAAATKYKEEYCQQLIDYFSKPATRVEYKETYFKGELSSRTPIVVPEEYPTFEMFAAKIGVTTDTLRNWCEDHPRFRYYYARAKEIQLGKLTSNAITGLYNPVYAKFEAVNNHNQKDKQEVETSVSGSLGVPMDDKTRALIERVEKRLSATEKKE